MNSVENKKEKESRVGDQECGCGRGHDLQFTVSKESSGASLRGVD